MEGLFPIWRNYSKYEYFNNEGELDFNSRKNPIFQVPLSGDFFGEPNDTFHQFTPAALADMVKNKFNKQYVTKSTNKIVKTGFKGLF